MLFGMVVIPLLSDKVRASGSPVVMGNVKFSQQEPEFILSIGIVQVIV